VSLSSHGDAAPPRLSEDDAQLATLLTRSGANVYRLYATTLPPVERSAPATGLDRDLTRIGDHYNRQLAASEASTALLTDMRDVVGWGGKVALAGSGVGAGAVIVADAAWNYATDQGIALLKTETENRARAVLATNLDKFLTTHGLTYESLQRLRPEQIRHKLELAEGPLASLKGKLAGDEAAYRIASDAVVTTIQRTQRVTLDKLATQGEQITKLGDALADQAKQIAAAEKTFGEQIDKQSQALKQVQGDVKAASEAVDRLDKATQANTRQTRAIAQFMFSNMSSRQKLDQLRACSGDSSGCLLEHIAPAQRTDLEKVLTAEVHIQDTVDGIAQLSRVATGGVQILRNLGMSTPELERAVNTASVAGSALSQALTGNYLGAAIALSGLFGGGGGDANAARHQQLMDFLSQNFKELNRKLYHILTNQRTIMEMISNLSQQLADYHVELQERLGNLAFEQGLAYKTVRALLWDKFAGCAVVWNGRTLEGRFAFDGTTGFQTYEHLAAVYRASALHFKSCAQRLEELMSQLSDPQTFSAAVNLAHVVDQDQGVVVPDQHRHIASSDLEKFLDSVYNPTITLIRRTRTTYLEADLLQLVSFAMPAYSLGSVTSKVSKLRSQDGRPCSIASKRIKALLCQDDRPGIADGLAASLLATPVSAPHAVKLATWSLPMATYRDWSTPEGTLMSPAEFARSVTWSPPGKRLLTDMSMLLDLAVAQTTMLYGDVTSKIVFDLVWDRDQKSFIEPPARIHGASGDGVEGSRQIAWRLMRNNPYLAQNVLMWALDATASPMLSQTTYSFALSFFDRDGGKVTQLESLFGAALSLSRDPGLGILASLPTLEPCADKQGDCASTITVPMPAQDEIMARTLSYPSRLEALLTLRRRLAAALADYDLLPTDATKDGAAVAAFARLGRPRPLAVGPPPQLAAR
jgi:hypothetical protein